MNLSTMLSLIFFTSFIFYFIIGCYILSISKGSQKNRVFFAVCFALTVWSFAFSIANSATDYESVLFWRRISAVGWGSLYSILLHFILILTGNHKIFVKKWTYLLIYLPAVITVFIFSIHGTISRGQYNLHLTASGWLNISVNNNLDWFFNIYYGIYTIASIVLIINWRLKADKKTRKAAQLLIVSIAAAFILGSVTDIILSTLIPGGIPQMAPVIILIPTMAIFYSIKKYDLLKTSKKYNVVVEGHILNEESRSKLYLYVSSSFVSISFIKMISYYFIYEGSLSTALIHSTVFFVCGIIVQVIDRVKIKLDIKDVIIGVIMSMSIPLITLNFIEHASLTVLLAPAIFLMLSVLFNNHRILIMLSVTVLLTQLWVWIKMPSMIVQVGTPDYLTSFYLLGIFIIATSYVNRIFINRLKENENQMQSQKLISKISASFLMVNKANIDEKICELLKVCSEQYLIDRSYLFLFSQNLKNASCRHEWCRDGIESEMIFTEEMPIEELPYWRDKILNCNQVCLSKNLLEPNEVNAGNEFLTQQRIHTLLAIPIISNGKAIGFLGFDSIENEKSWRDDDCEILDIISNILADALIKVSTEEEIKHLAFFDSLTGLPNRTLFNDRLIKQIQLSKRTEKLIGVVFIDLDSFKEINDTMGHESGDDLLKQIAGRLSVCLRKQDTVSRFGGDEFLIMITNISQIKDLTKLVCNIMKIFEIPITVKGQEFFLTASLGVSTYPLDGEDAEILIKNADMAMYTSKNQGKNKYSFCSSAIKEDVMQKMKLTNSLYRAQERNELELFYQPQVCVATKKIIGLEALIRWNHPELGMVMPKDFIHLAEQTGLIIPIGDWVLRTACSQSMAWQLIGIPPIRTAVNLSAEQFRQPDLIKTVQTALIESGLSAEFLELEITESIAMKSSTNIINTLIELKKLGLTISIDDFGTEYSSLNRLKLLPIDRIKMDKHFVNSISKSSKDDAIVKIIIQLAQKLDLKVIAEGVETKSQLDFLMKEVCDEVQGNYYFEPMPAIEIERLLRNQYCEDIT